MSAQNHNELLPNEERNNGAQPTGSPQQPEGPADSVPAPEHDEIQNTQEAAPPAEAEPAPDTEEDAAEAADEEAQNRAQADVATALVEKALVELWHDQDQNAYATVNVNGHREHITIGTRPFRDFVKHRYWKAMKRHLSRSALDDVIETLVARARFDGQEREAFIRVAHANGKVYVDLCNKAWEVVEISKSGFKVISNPPVRFVRRYGMQELPHPSPAQDARKLELLKNLLNLPQDNDRTFCLIVADLIGAFNPTQSYPVLVLNGPQGSGKSTLSRYFRALIDPHSVPIQAPPRTEQELIITASNSFLLIFDNISYVRQWLSDGLCRVATGGGFRNRKLYEGREEELFFVTRPVVINGIGNVIDQNDLADRALFISLPSISTHERQGQARLDEEFTKAWPDLLGALYAAVSEALRNHGKVSMEHTPRMADFALWVKAAENVLPFPPGFFDEVYRQNQQQFAEESVEHDEVAAMVVKLMEKKETWEGSITDLSQHVTVEDLFSQNRPGLRSMSTRMLLERLLRAVPVLRQVGIEVDYDPDRKHPQSRRTILIIRKHRPHGDEGMKKV